MATITLAEFKAAQARISAEIAALTRDGITPEEAQRIAALADELNRLAAQFVAGQTR